MRHCQHNWSGVLDCTKCGAEKGIGELQAEIKRLKVSLGKHSNRILQLHERLKVLQDAQIAAVTQDHRNLFKYTDEVRAALLGDQALQGDEDEL